MASRRLSLDGSEFQVNVNSGGLNGISGAQDLPSATALTDGRFVIGYQSDYFGSATDTDPIISIIGSIAYRDVFNAGAHQNQLVLAQRNDGVGVIFTNARHANNTVDANGPNITFVPVTGAGAVLSPIAVADFNSGSGHDALQNPAAATLSTGRQVVAFERIWTVDVDHDVFLNVVNAAGTATQFSVANPLDVIANASWQANPEVAAFGNQALVVFEDGTGTTTASANIRARLFDGDSNTLGGAFTVADHADRLRTADVATLTDGRYVIVYGDQNDLWGRIYNPETGTFQASEFQIDVTGGFALNPAVASTIDGGFIVTWADYNGANYDVLAHRFDAHGTSYGGIFIATTLTDASQFTPTIASSGASFVIAWTDFATRATDAAAPGIRAQLFNILDTSLRRYDFNGDFQGDLLLQNASNGAVRFLLRDGTANPIGFTDTQVGGGGDTNWRIITGGGDFNGDDKNDILWQHTNGAITQWLVNGTTFTQSGLIGGGGDPNWRIIATGDFNNDTLSDIVWQNSATGAITIWEKNGVADPTNFSQFSNLGGSGSPGWKVITTGDFNQDGRSDLLWQQENTGTVTIWLMNGGNSFTQTGLIGGGGDPNWRIIATGELNGDSTRNDILWQHTNGAISIWLHDTSTANPESFQQFSLVGGNGDPNWRIKGTADVNQDGRSDVLFQNVNTGSVVEWLMEGGANFTQTGVVPGTNDAAWQLIGVA